MADFKIAFEKTLILEGGYANHPADKGGETYCGIARNFFPNWSGWIYIDSLKSKPDFPKNIDKQKLLPEIENFYKKQFWDTLRLDEIKAQDIAEEIYDTGVNMGEKTAVKIVQEACNLLNRDGKDYPELEVDGVIGKNTVNTINNHPYPKTLYNLLNFLQAERYIEICRKNRTQEVFMRGWLNTRIISKN